MTSPFVTIAEGMKENKRVNPKIGAGYIVKSKVGNMGDNAREERIRRMNK